MGSACGITPMEENLLWNLFFITFLSSALNFQRELSAPHILYAFCRLLPPPTPPVTSLNMKKLNVFFQKKKKTFKAIFISTAISYLINNRCLIKCKLVLYPLLYLLNLLLTVFTKFVSFGSKAFCKLFINSKLKWRQFFYVKAPALAVSNRVLQWALCSPCPYANCPCHLETPPDRFLAMMQCFPPVKVVPSVVCHRN